MSDSARSTNRSHIVRHVFVLAAERAGGTSRLVRGLGISYSEVKTYLAGEAMPPREVLLRAMDLLSEDLKAMIPVSR